ncbi:hypothetical protein BXO88_05560 [Oribacterium sp. C9]|uniref:hypothetical protein n=1 Tax=Oribacterium sp. C9 TaxID=1943579 RepID=UPI000990041B|nr:hypothetical protein [Oribacterium sp. C9]OON87007.1 hypothetical protein BXO88_05560 [Oribacterium sp. C9]
MQKRLLSVLLVCVIIFLFSVPVMAHEKSEHDEDIEYVLFRNKDYKKTHPNSSNSKKIQAIEDATYLCVDQFNGKGIKELENLHNEKIPDIPKSIDEFDFKDNYTHRKHTHRGWNVNYDRSAHWDIRQRILRNTVDKVLFSEVKSVFSFLPWDSDGKKYKEQCESFCQLLYYIHIIGDHIAADKYNALYYTYHLTQLHDRDNPGIIPDLISCFEKLFKSQKNTYMYNQLKQELEMLMDKSDKIQSSTGGVNTEEKFAEYHKCAIDLLEVLSTYVPELLRKEDFFSKSFS